MTPPEYDDYERRVTQSSGLGAFVAAVAFTVAWVAVIVAIWWWRA